MHVGSLLLALGMLGPQGADSINGRVYAHLTGWPLAGVRVTVLPAGADTVTDEQGRYRLSWVGPEARRIQFTRAGYDTVTVEVLGQSAGAVELNVELVPFPLELKPITVVARLPWRDADGLADQGTATDPGRRRYDAGQLEDLNPAAAGDPLLALADHIGVGPSTSLRLRGGDGDQTRLALDGIPVYGAFHLGGVAGIVDPLVLGSMVVDGGAPPATTGGWLSGTTELQLRPVERGVTLSGSLDQASVRQAVALGAEDGSADLLVSGRQSYRGVLNATGENTATRFGDLLVRGALRRGRDSLTAYLLGSRDELGFAADLSSAAPDQLHSNLFRWTSTSAGLVWRRPLGASVGFTGRLWRSATGSTVQWWAPDGPRTGHHTLEDVGGDVGLQLIGTVTRWRVGAEVHRWTNAYDIRSAAAGAQGPSFRRQAAPTVWSLYSQLDRAVGSRGLLSGGFRVNALSGQPVTIEPRVSGRWQFLPTVSLSAGYARGYQFLRSLRNEGSLLNYLYGAELLVSGNRGERPARVDQWAAALEAQPAAGITLRLNGYLRDFRHLYLIPVTTTGVVAVTDPQVGNGTARGVVVEGMWNHDRLTIGLQAGLERSRRSGVGLEYAASAGRGDWATGALSYRLAGQTMFGLAARVVRGEYTTPVVGGLEWQPPARLTRPGELAGTPTNVGGVPLHTPVPGSLDLSLSVRRAWSVPLGVREGRVVTTLWLANLLNQSPTIGFVAPINGSGSPTALAGPGRALGLSLQWLF